ncbi:lantibiotic dehydratase [Pseudovibrio exalbescens]|uniref:lantibiotic dehydratase n=1 Tax=Pseudovibrio exalbescens TaxID=197461 RepID=UPI000C9C959F|nr:lantibiotic dehydratase [Pseudovibrio exalbescens]
MRKWKLAPHFLIRSAGFPLELLQGLNCCQTAQRVDRLLKEEQRLERLAQEMASRWMELPKLPGLKRKSLFKSLAGKAAFSEERLKLAAVEPTLKADMDAWNEALSALLPLQQEVEQTLRRELLAARQHLTNAFDDPLLHEAVFLSSPSMYKNGLENLSAPAAERSSAVRRQERQLALYLQRFTAKNETTSFFGPINYGKVLHHASPEDAETWPIRYSLSTEGVRRRAFMAFWAVKALATTIAIHPRVRTELKPVLVPGCKVQEDGTLWIAAANRSVKLSGQQGEILSCLNKGRSFGELAREAGLCPEALEDVLRPFMEKRLVEMGIHVPMQEADALQWLKNWLDALNIDDEQINIWRDLLGMLCRKKALYPLADASQKQTLLKETNELFTKFTGQESSRNQGAIYADRFLLYEEGVGPLEHGEMASAFAEKMTANLAPLLDIWALAGQQRSAFLKTLGKQIYQSLYGESTAQVPFAKFMRDVLGHEKLKEWESEAASIQSAVAQHLTNEELLERLGDRYKEDGIEVLKVPGSSLVAAAKQLADQQQHDQTPLICSPDIMIAKTPAGAPRMVLGEVHDTAMVWGWALGLHPQHPKPQEEMWAFLAPISGQDCANIAGSTRLKITPFRYPGVTIPVSAGADTEGVETIDLSEVWVRVQHDGLALMHDASEVPLTLFNGELSSLLHQIFALPRVVPFTISFGAFTPRIEVDEIVLQRARWILDRTELGLDSGSGGDTCALMTGVRRAQLKTGLPEQVFAKIPGQPKPVMVDFRSPLSLEYLEALMPSEGHAVLTEMMPDHNGLWLDVGTGKPHTAEIRCTYAAVAEQEAS